MKPSGKLPPSMIPSLFQILFFYWLPYHQICSSFSHPKKICNLPFAPCSSLVISPSLYFMVKFLERLICTLLSPLPHFSLITHLSQSAPQVAETPLILVTSSLFLAKLNNAFQFCIWYFGHLLSTILSSMTAYSWISFYFLIIFFFLVYPGDLFFFACSIKNCKSVVQHWSSFLWIISHLSCLWLLSM